MTTNKFSEQEISPLTIHGGKIDLTVLNMGWIKELMFQLHCLCFIFLCCLSFVILAGYNLFHLYPCSSLFFSFLLSINISSNQKKKRLNLHRKISWRSWHIFNVNGPFCYYFNQWWVENGWWGSNSGTNVRQTNELYVVRFLEFAESRGER